MASDKKRTFTYKRTINKSGEISCTIYKETARMIDLYCEINNINTTYFINETMDAFIRDKFKALKEATK